MKSLDSQFKQLPRGLQNQIIRRKGSLSEMKIRVTMGRLASENQSSQPLTILRMFREGRLQKRLGYIDFGI